jgi:hypothetical protein
VETLHKFIVVLLHELLAISRDNVTEKPCGFVAKFRFDNVNGIASSIVTLNLFVILKQLRVIMQKCLMVI